MEKTISREQKVPDKKKRRIRGKKGRKFNHGRGTYIFPYLQGEGFKKDS